MIKNETVGYYEVKIDENNNKYLEVNSADGWILDIKKRLYEDDVLTYSGNNLPVGAKIIIEYPKDNNR